MDRDDVQDQAGDSIEVLANRIASATSSDVFCYLGAIVAPADDLLRDMITTRHHLARTLVMVMRTYGGDPDAAYRVTRCIHRYYSRFVLIVAAECKSAGTLIALGADELVMCDGAELGPIDMQVVDKEEVGEMSSGLTPQQALVALRSQAHEVFDDGFRRLRQRRFPTRLAAQVAAELTIGVLRPLYEQIDPIRLGQVAREISIAKEYSQRLARDNAKPDAIARLIAGYPSHGFVIDAVEAKDLFNRVREPTEDEAKLLALVTPIFDRNRRDEAKGRIPFVSYLSEAHTVDGESGEGTVGGLDGEHETGGKQATGPADRAGTEAVVSGAPRNPQAGGSADAAGTGGSQHPPVPTFTTEPKPEGRPAKVVEDGRRADHG